MTTRPFTSESVTEGHPTRSPTRSATPSFDAPLRMDASSRGAVETLITTGYAHVAGEAATKACVPLSIERSYGRDAARGVAPCLAAS